MNLSEAFQRLESQHEAGYLDIITRDALGGIGFYPNGKHGIVIYDYDSKKAILVDGEVAKWQPNVNDFTRDDWYVDKALIEKGEKMTKLDDVQGYTARWYGEEGDLIIDGIDENDMTKEELDSKRQSVTVYTKKQVMELLNKENGIQ